MKILVDNGHGIDTPGKCSPDGSYREYEFAREIADGIVSWFWTYGYDAELLVPEVHDISLRERVRRANQACSELGTQNVLLMSIHSNASGMGDWMPARGWRIYTSVGITKSDTWARYLYKAAKENFIGQKVGAANGDRDPDFEANFYIIYKSYCPAVLTENFFHDNREDLEYIKSDEGKTAIIKTHVEGTINYIDSL